MTWKKFIDFILKAIVLGIIGIVIYLFIRVFNDGLSKFNNTKSFSEMDIVSYQISLLEIILTAVTLGAGILGFIGWREIKNHISDDVRREMIPYKEEIKKIIENTDAGTKSNSKGKKKKGLSAKDDEEESND